MIRDATLADAPAILAIWNPLIRETGITFNAVEKTKANLIAMIKDRQASGHCFVVAVQNGAVVGFATYAQFRGGVGYAHTMEHSVILDANARGAGLGRALMQAVETHAKNSGVHVMIAGVSSANPGAIAFHTALGYKETAVLAQVGRKFDQWFDLHLMQKVLSA